VAPTVGSSVLVRQPGRILMYLKYTPALHSVLPIRRIACTHEKITIFRDTHQSKQGEQTRMKTLIMALTLALLFIAPLAHSVQKAGIHLDEEITTENGEVLQLNGVGLREKFWVDIYVGSLYLADKNSNVAEILSTSSAYRLQMDFVYKEVAKQKLLKAWRDGFEKNQDKETMAQLKSRAEQFYSYFGENAVRGDRYILDYIPGTGTKITKNNKLQGVIPGADFKNALLEIWLGNFPADDGLKKGLLGL
jgi:hypothetical protein